MTRNYAWICALLLVACATTEHVSTSAREESGDAPVKRGKKVAAAPSRINNVTSNWEAKRPALAVDGKGTLHVAYQSFEEGKPVPDIFYTQSSDAGRTWTKGVSVSKTPGVSDEPGIAVTKQGGIIVTWSDSTSGDDRPDIFAAHSSDAGRTWSKSFDISNTNGRSSQPAVAVATDGTIQVVWLDTSDSAASPDIWGTHSSDGATWSKPQNISHTPGISKHPTVSCGPKGEVYVAWADTTDGEASQDIWFTGSMDGGRTWATSVNVSHTTGASSDPDIAVDDAGSIYVAWYDSTVGESHPDIFFTSSRDHGNTFDPYLNLSHTPRISSALAVAASGDGQVAVTWRDTSNPDFPPDIWYASSSNSGKTFSPAEDLSRTPGVSDVPDIVIFNNTAYVVWDEYENSRTLVKMSRSTVKK